jgi:hypothetical protein
VHDTDIFINDKWRKYAGGDIGRLFKITKPTWTSLLTNEKVKSTFTMRLLCPNRPPTWVLEVRAIDRNRMNRGSKKSFIPIYYYPTIKINGTKKTVSNVQPTEVRLYTPSLPQTYLLVFLTYHFCCWFFKFCSVNLHIEVLSGSTVSTKINSICINRKFLDNSISKYRRRINTFCTMPINAYHISWAIIITKLYTDVDVILIYLITRSYL